MITIEQLLHEQRTLTRHKQEFAAHLRPLLASIGYALTPTNGPEPIIAPKTRARRRTLKCPRCDRHFRLPMHLSRHVKAMHATPQRSA
jgi:hypothetical protein